jgi:aconitate decarboxylase
VDELPKGLGEVNQSDNIRVKSHARLAGTNCSIDTVAQLQKEYPNKTIELGEDLKYQY